MNTQPIRVGVVDDDALVRTGLVMMLGGATDLSVVGQAGDGDEVPALLDGHPIDVLLMDIRMPRVDGITATQRLRTRPDPPSVIVLTTFNTDDMVISALRAGADGFLLKDTPPADIVRAIRQVAGGDAVLSPAVTRHLVGLVGDAGQHSRRTTARARVEQLSPREHEVAAAIARGLSNAEIAAQLFVSVATVKATVSRVLAKLDVDNRVQIALLFYDADLI